MRRARPRRASTRSSTSTRTPGARRSPRPPGEACEPPTLPALGWDGAPAWATLDGGAAALLPAGHARAEPRRAGGLAAPSSPTPPGPGGVGIQTRYVRMLGHVARRFARSSAVAGFDLMNEPNAIGRRRSRRRSPAFYARALAQIRAGERAGQGRRHLVLSSPRCSGRRSAAARRPTSSATATSSTRRTSTPAASTTGRSPRARSPWPAARHAAFGGAPVLSGEWGADPGAAPATRRPLLPRHQALQDAFRRRAPTLWTWRESCGDPHKVGDFRAGRRRRSGASSRSTAATNRVTDLRRALVGAAHARLRARRPGTARAHPLQLRGHSGAGGPRGAAAGPLVAFLPRVPAERRRRRTSTCPRTA